VLEFPLPASCFLTLIPSLPSSLQQLLASLAFFEIEIMHQEAEAVKFN
jgi:hypothetical protein